MPKNKLLRSLIGLLVFGLLTVLIFTLTFNFLPDVYPAINKDAPYFSVSKKLVTVSLLFSTIASGLICWMFFRRVFQQKNKQ